MSLRDNKKEIQANLDLNSNSIENFQAIKMRLESWVGESDGKLANLIRFDQSGKRICIFNAKDSTWNYFYEGESTKKEIERLEKLIQEIRSEEKYKFDNTPTAGSENLVNSGDIYEYIENKLGDIDSGESTFGPEAILTKQFGTLPIGTQLEGTAVEAIVKAFCKPISFTINSFTASPTYAYKGDSVNVTLSLAVAIGSNKLNSVEIEGSSLSVSDSGNAPFKTKTFTKTISNVTSSKTFNSFSVTDGTNTDNNSAGKTASIKFYHKLYIGKSKPDALPTTDAAVKSASIKDFGINKTGSCSCSFDNEYLWVAVPSGNGFKIASYTENGYGSDGLDSKMIKAGNYDLFLYQNAPANDANIHDFTITINKGLEV